MNTSNDVALILWNLDVIDLLSLVLLKRNLKATGIEPSEGVERIEELIVTGGAGVVVFDLEPPYHRSAAVVMRLMAQFADRSFVMTCADPAIALKAAPWLSSHRLFQKPYETDEIVETVLSIVTQPSKSLAVSMGA